MSDSPLPPPPGGSTPPPPPPPPPGLTAPPGYAAYHGTATVPLKRVGGVARAAGILVGAAAATSVLSIVATRAVRGDAQAYLDDEISGDAFLEAIAPFAIFSLLQLLSLLAAATVVMVWMYRIATNLRTLHRGTTWGPGWAIGGWFAPPLLYVIPFLALREQWKASDPDVPIGDDWRRTTASPLVTAWFVIFGPVQLAIQAVQIGDTFGGLGGSETVMAEQITASQVVPSIAAVTDVAAAVLFVLVVRGLTGRHRRLTGERD